MSELFYTRYKESIAPFFNNSLFLTCDDDDGDDDDDYDNDDSDDDNNDNSNNIKRPLGTGIY